jgi:hypothetical protein
VKELYQLGAFSIANSLAITLFVPIILEIELTILF